MGALLARVARQQTLLDAWADLRRRAEPGSHLAAEAAGFERLAATKLAGISTDLREGRWRPHPVRPAALPKPDGGSRTLGIPSLEDRIVERAVLMVLDPVIDPNLMPWSFAYRRGLGVGDAIDALVGERDRGCDRVVRGDVADCFESVPRMRLLDQLGHLVDDAELLEVIRLLVYRPVAGTEGSAPVGLHQGSSLSPLLANVYLDAFDRAMASHGWRVIRYADDFAVAATGHSEALAALHTSRSQLAELGLTLSDDKCSIRTFDEGVPFLGATVSSLSTGRAARSARPLQTSVYVVNEGGLLRSKGNRLRLERDGETVFSLSTNRVRQVVIFGRTGLTTPLIHQLLQRGIDVVFLGAKGRYFGRLQAAVAANPAVRRSQFRAVEDPERRLAIAKAVVRGKIANLRVGVLRAARRLGADELQRTVWDLERDRRRVDEAGTIASLLGVEGSASRRYFGILGDLLTDPWTFTGRRRRPPPDPVNALLSLGYTLLLHDAIAALEAASLDPYQGFLHDIATGRPSLALDLIEELRPVVVDSVVIRCLNTRALVESDFEIDPGPPLSCSCTPDGLRKFLAAYERRILTSFSHVLSGRRISYRVGLMLQARHLAEVCADPAANYQPISWK